MRAFFRLVAATILAFGVAGCTSVSYYAQALEGHVKIMAARRDVGKLINDPSTSEALRARMESAREIRQFAVDELALPDNRSYRSYVDVGPEAVTWAVFAAPEFSLTPHAWCFPVYGCVPYKGYFSKKSATEFAAGLQRQGLDVHVTGITAYSTLGWSKDPLLSTMLTQGDTHLAEVVFHELAHQRVYIHGDSEFNEAFAVAVETTGVRKWLRAAGDTAGLRRYEADRRRRADFLALVSQTREELRHIYESSGTVSEKRAAKAAAFERLRTRYRRLRDDRWHGYRAFDAWFDAPINNAKLAVVSVYDAQVKSFLRLFDLCSGDYPRFYASVEQLGKLNKADRARALESAQACYDAGHS
ncbi:aminopeptidase [Mesorhizobium sp. BAC0120]|uniref:aminopeptidase n=1 Tax=Mesorhizobium sp. BAC0120 TaxID=3090670 RepID=UPI00298C7C97|nr:aminopeptidase [Mesorhizobium sp. BAC0120]MDW6026000.1 aminopeptidase [Mesorhizobium sp. BAC0120]